jgi:hypothetical protein
VATPVIRYINRDIVIHLKFSFLPFESLFNSIEVDSENLPGLIFIQWFVLEADMDSRCKSFIEVTYSIGGKK